MGQSRPDGSNPMGANEKTRNKEAKGRGTLGKRVSHFKEEQKGLRWGLEMIEKLCSGPETSRKKTEIFKGDGKIREK